MLNRLDRAIAYVAPGFAARRAQARIQIQAFEAIRGYYDGADMGRRGKSIRRSGAAADAISQRTLPRLRSGSHDLVRNNPHAKRGVETIVTNTVGTGILPKFRRGRETVQELEELAQQTLETTSIDVDGRHDYYGLQALAMRTTVESGESLVVRRINSSLPFPVQFQVLEPDFLDSSKDGPTKNGGRTIQGIEFDSAGRRVRYWLFREHPGNGRSVVSEPVPAQNVAHIYRVDRPGQVRGIPWLAPVMLPLADFDDYGNAQLVRQKIAACYAVFYTDPMGSPQTTATTERVEPGMIQRLSGGADVKFASPPMVTGFEDYSRVTLRAISAGLGVSYEALTGDLKGVSFSAGRMGWLEYQRNISAWQWLMVIPQGCAVMMDWWLDGARLIGRDVQDVRVKHTPPRREMINPVQEIPARTAARRAGQETLSDQLQESGKDLHDHLEEFQYENELLDKAGIVLDSDPRKVSAAGLTQARSGGSLSLPPTGDPDDTGGVLPSSDDEDLDDE